MFAANQNAIWTLQIFHRRALREKLGIREHLVIQLLSARAEDRQDGFRGFHRDGALLNDDFRFLDDRSNHAGNRLDKAEVGGPARTHAKGLGRRVDTHKDDVRGANGVLHAGREKQISAAGGLDHLVEPRFVDRKVIGVPGVDSCLIEIDHFHTNVGTFRGDHRHRRAADIAGTDAANLNCKFLIL